MEATREDDHSIHRALAGAAGVTLVVIGAAGCGACRAMLRAVAALPAGVVARVFEVDAGEAPGLVADLEVFHLPALFLYRDGVFHRPVAAPPVVGALRAAIEAAAAAEPVAPP